MRSPSYVTIRRVPTPVSVIIPALNEEAWIAGTIERARATGAAEVIVCDGGSSDATVSTAETAGARVITGQRLRALQLNAGAAAAAFDTLLFLHADTHLPAGALAAVAKALDDGAVFGGFQLAFLEPGLEWVARLINLRTRLTRAPWGDQAQFVHRSRFVAAGGYPPFPIMEDYELARRMKREGRVAVLPLAVRTSGRRFLTRGVLTTTALNWLIIAAYHLGVSPERLARWYRG